MSATHNDDRGGNMTTSNEAPKNTDETIQLRTVSVAAPAAQERPRGHRAPRTRRSARETARSVWAGVARCWHGLWPVAVGVVLGTGATLGILALAWLVWFDLSV